jgi:hypothetical protein
MDIAENLYGTPDMRECLKALDENVGRLWVSTQTMNKAIETGNVEAMNKNHELVRGFIDLAQKIPEVFRPHLAVGSD